MPDRQVRCITKTPRLDPHEGITHLGGVDWYLSRDQVIRSIRLNEYTYYTLERGYRSTVGIIAGPSGPYLRTHADGAWNDNLLALPECKH